MTKENNRQGDRNKLAHSGSLCNSQSAKFSLHLVNENVTESHRKAEQQQPDSHSPGMPHNKRVSVFQLSTATACDESKQELEVVHLEHQMPSCRLPLLTDAILVRSIDSVTN